MAWKIRAYYVSDPIVISTNSNLRYPLTQLPGLTVKTKNGQINAI
jgi:hypothetical protein